MKKILLLACLLSVNEIKAGTCCTVESKQAEKYVAFGAFPDTFPAVSVTNASDALKAKFAVLGIPNTQTNTEKLILQTINQYTEAAKIGDFNLVDKVLFNNDKQSWLPYVNFQTLFAVHGNKLKQSFEAGASQAALPTLSSVDYVSYLQSDDVWNAINSEAQATITDNMHSSLSVLSTVENLGQQFYDSRYLKMLETNPNSLLESVSNRLKDEAQQYAANIWMQYTKDKSMPTISENADETLEVVKLLTNHRQLAEGKDGSDLLAYIYQASLADTISEYNTLGFTDDEIRPSSVEEIRAIFGADINRAIQLKEPNTKVFEFLQRYYNLTSERTKVTLTDKDKAQTITDFLEARKNKNEQGQTKALHNFFLADKQAVEDAIRLNFLNVLAYNLGKTGALNTWNAENLYNAFKDLRVITKSDVDSFMGSSDGKTLEGLVFLQYGKEMEVKDNWWEVLSKQVGLDTFLEQPTVKELIKMAQSSDISLKVSAMIAQHTEIDDLLIKLEGLKANAITKADNTTDWASKNIKDLVASASKGADTIDGFVTNVSTQISNLDVQNIVRNAASALAEQANLQKALNALTDLPASLEQNIKSLDVNDLVKQTLSKLSEIFKK